MRLNPIATTLLASAFFATSALAAQGSKQEYESAKDRIKAEYKAASKQCSSLSGNAQDICKAEAKGKQKVAKAEAEAAYKGTPKSATDAAIARADADYDIAKEKCDDLKGNPKDVCQKEAKAAHTKAKADAKAGSKVAEVRK